MEAPICHQILYGRPCPRKQLHLIKNNERLLGIKGNSVDCRQVHEKSIQIIKILVKKILDIFSCFVEIYQDVRAIVLFCKLFHYIAFSDTPCTVYKKSCFSCTFFLPFKQFLCYLPSHFTPFQGFYILNFTPFQGFVNL